MGAVSTHVRGDALSTHSLRMWLQDISTRVLQITVHVNPAGHLARERSTIVEVPPIGSACASTAGGEALPDKRQDLAALERYWYERWMKAKLDLEAAHAHFDSMKDDVSAGLYGPDGGYAYRSALEEETAALLEYSRVLRIYTDLVLHGKIPDEDPLRSKSKTAE